MTTLNAPFGLRPANHPTGLDRAKRYAVAPGYGTVMYKGQPCILNTNGTVVAGTAAADILGVLQGFEYVDVTGKPWVSSFWPAGQQVLAGTQPYAWVLDDPEILYEVQADGPVLLTAVGDQADVSNIAAFDPGSFNSRCTMSAALAGAGAQAQFRILGFGLGVDNLPGDAFTVVQIKIARHQFVANKVAI